MAAIPYVRNDGKSELALSTAVVSVVESYLDSMLGSVGQVVNAGYDDPLDDAGGLLEQMERLPVICRYRYTQVGQIIIDR